MAIPVRKIHGGVDAKFKAWRVYRSLGNVETTENRKKDRVGISGGLLSTGSRSVSTSDFAAPGNYNAVSKVLTTEDKYPDIFLDLQTNKYLYANVNLSTYAVTLEYKDQAPSGTGAITMSSDSFQRFSLAYITENKTVLDLRPIGGGTSTPVAATKPFTLIKTAQADPSTDFDITVWPGTINQIIPTGIVGTSFVYTANSNIYIKLAVVTSGHQITSASIEQDTSPTVAVASTLGGPPSNFKILLGVMTANIVYQVWLGNIWSSPVQTLVTERAAPNPGESIYDRWWNWSHTVVA